MANKRFTPKALAVPQLDTITIANTWAGADTATVTQNEKDLVLTVGAITTTVGIAEAIAAMINGDTALGTETRSETGDNVAEFREVSATAASSVVSVLGGTKGRPFTLTSTESTAGSGTATQATVTAATGPNHFDNVDNWGGSAIPADNDTVYFDNSDVSVLYGLSNPNIEPTAVFVALSYTGEIGLPETNQDGQYHEYRPTYLRLGMAALTIGTGEGNGSGRLKFDSGDDVCALLVINTGTSLDELSAFIWKGTHASNTLVMRAGSVGIALFGAETATLSTFTVDDGELTLGAGVTLSGALVVNGGVVRINSLIDGSLTVNGGTVIIDGTGNVDQLTIRGGTVIYNTTGTLGGNTVVSGAGVLDFGQAPGIVQVTNPIDIYGTECLVLDPLGRVWDGANARRMIVDGNEGANPAAQVDWGTNLRLQRGATA